MSRLSLITLLLILSVISGHAIDLGLTIGGSHFRYVEEGEDSKDDLFTFNSVDIGLNYSMLLGRFYAQVEVSAQLPYELTFRDALGTDDYNYLDDMFYFGLNSNLSIAYQFLDTDDVDLYIALLLNFDYFYMQDMVIVYGTEYIFSILGTGSELTVELPLNDSLYLDISGAYIFNFLPLYDRDADFMWSDNILVSASLVWSFGDE